MVISEHQDKCDKTIADAIKVALEKMEKDYCSLSQISRRANLEIEKYLERPFCYEFYHQLRRLIEKGVVNFGGPIVQAEVDKTYQHYFENGKVPDFIFHIPDTQQNLAVVEFKLASHHNEIEKDFQKLIEFKRELGYQHLIEVIIGDDDALKRTSRFIDSLHCSEIEGITLIEFNTTSWKARDR